MREAYIKRSNFSFYAFGDEISEKDFMGADFCILSQQKSACFSISLLDELDYSFFEQYKNNYDTFVFEDLGMLKEISSFLQTNPQVQSFKLRIETKEVFEIKLTHIKVQRKAIILQSFQ